MVSSLTLSTKELIYVSMLSGIGNIWGIADPYVEMPEDVIRIDILRIQKSLIEKRYAITDEDGSFSLFDGVTQLLRICNKSKYMYQFSSNELEQNNYMLRYYVSDDMIIRLEVKEKTTLSFIQLPDMEDELSMCFCSGEGDIWSGTLNADTSRLKQYGSISRNRFVQELKEKGCNDSLSVIIANGLQGTSSFRTLVCYDTSSMDANIPVEQIVTMHFPGGNLIARPDHVSMSESITLCKLSKGQLLEEIHRITQRILLNGGDQFAS